MNNQKNVPSKYLKIKVYMTCIPERPSRIKKRTTMMENKGPERDFRHCSLYEHVFTM